MYKTSGAGDVNLSGYNNKKFTTDFPQWVDKITPVACSILFQLGTASITCIKNTHKDHTTTNRNLYGCILIIDKSHNQWYMQFPFPETIEEGTTIDFSEHVIATHTMHIYYTTESIKTTGTENTDWKELYDGCYLFKDVTLFENKPKFVCNK